MVQSLNGFNWSANFAQLWCYIQGGIRSLMHLTHWGGDKIDTILQTMFSNAMSWMKMFEFWLKFHLKFVPKGPINNIPALVQIMAWRRTGNKPLSEPMMTQFNNAYACVTRPQWVNIATVSPPIFYSNSNWMEISCCCSSDPDHHMATTFSRQDNVAVMSSQQIHDIMINVIIISKWRYSGFLPEASFGLRVLSLPAFVCVCVCLCVNDLLVRAITRDPFKLRSPNLDQRCKRPWLRSLLFCGLNDLDLQGQI